MPTRLQALFLAWVIWLWTRQTSPTKKKKKKKKERGKHSLGKKIFKHPRYESLWGPNHFVNTQGNLRMVFKTFHILSGGWPNPPPTNPAPSPSPSRSSSSLAINTIVRFFDYRPDIKLNAVCASHLYSSQQSHELGGIIIPISQMRKLRQRYVNNNFAPSHTTYKWEAQDENTGNWVPEPTS